ncbi:MAG: 2-succinyl-5-enolpyruvyl-6-hydroxy-3-cyclohexene-1-carboxylic-acid synthase [Verrucomicrobiota bacterium]
MTEAEVLAKAVVTRCLERGIREYVVCSGSRNSPLVIELLRYADSDDVTVWSHFEERAASFFALGRSRSLEAPVAVVTTSGTAVGELYPAMIEALYQRVPLLAITADRPKRYRGTGAPQAIEQAGIFCLYSTANWDLDQSDLDFSQWDGWGPAHLNICLEEPLLSSPVSEELDGDVPKIKAPLPAHEPPFPVSRKRGLRVPDVVLLGSLFAQEREAVEQFLIDLGRPILADATSGLRESASLRSLMITGGEREVDVSSLRAILRVGGVPSFRIWRDLESADVSVYSVLCRGFSGLARTSLLFDELSELDFRNVDLPKTAFGEGETPEELDRLLEAYPQSEPGVFRKLSSLIPHETSVFLGNSLPVREWNLAAIYDKEHRYWANRGANGIDGGLSTWMGLSAASAEESWGIFGDLTTLYDLSAPWISKQLVPGSRRLVVVNNGGGRIFGRLPGLSQVRPSTRKITECEHTLSFKPLAELWGFDYQAWGKGSPKLGGENVLLEIVPSPEQTKAFWKEWAASRQ